MSSDAEKILSIQILDKKFEIKCPTSKVDELQQSAYYLDGKMREIRDSGKAIGSEHVAIMAALNLSYELLNVQRQKDLYLDTMGSRVRDLQEKITNALAQSEQKEL